MYLDSFFQQNEGFFKNRVKGAGFLYAIRCFIEGPALNVIKTFFAWCQFFPNDHLCQ